MLVRSCFWRITAIVAVALCCSQRANADQVILDDLIVDGSICVGFDCVNGESFGFDTLRLKENNLRIRGVDTSTSASFPTNDWQITFNDSSNGGAEKFSIDDIDAGRTPFTIEAGARSNALYVEDDGDIGLGTSVPVVNLHIVDGNTPTLRLEQDGSSGFTPQTWDVAGNEANFFIRDVTNGSTLPFRVAPGAPNSVIRMFNNKIAINDSGANYDTQIRGDTEANLFYADASTDHVGIGTDTPGSLLFVGSGTPAGGTLAGINVALDNTPAYVTASDGTHTVFFGADQSNRGIVGTLTNHRLDLRTNNVERMTILPSGNVGIGNTNPGDRLEVGPTGGGANAVCNGVTWADASSRKIKDNITDLDADEALKAFKELVPVKYNYKLSPDEQSVGFIAEDVPELVARNDRKHLTALDIVAVLTKVSQQQQGTIEHQEQMIAELTERLGKLEAQRPTE